MPALSLADYKDAITQAAELSAAAGENFFEAARIVTKYREEEKNREEDARKVEERNREYYEKAVELADLLSDIKPIV